MAKVANEYPDGYVDAVPSENPISCCLSCITDCCIPYHKLLCMCCCPCCTVGFGCPPTMGSTEGGMTYKLKDKGWKSAKINTCHTLQSWLIRHPVSEGLFSCCCCVRCCISIHDVAAYGASMIMGFNKEIGESWCDNMKIEVADPEMVRTLLTSPQDGNAALGQAWLRPHKLPASADGQTLFPIALPNGLEGGSAEDRRRTERHAMIRRLMWKYLINEGSTARQATTDEVVQRLLMNMRAAAHGKPLSDYGATKEGLPGFILRYIHYVCFGIDLTDAQFEQLWLLYFNPGPGLGESSLILIAQKYIGGIMEFFGANKAFKHIPQRRRDAVALYKTTPAMANYKDEPLPADEFLDGMITVFGFAGLMGPMGAASHTLGNYKRYIPKDFAWPFGDRAAIQTAVLEAMRMQPAVFGSGLVVPRPLQCTMKGKKVTFPAGTAVHANFVACNRNRKVWGDDADAFNPQGHAANLNVTGGGGSGFAYPNFNSWGGDMGKDDKATGRECPGKELSLAMLVDLVEYVLNPKPPSVPPSPPASPPAMSRS